MINKTVITTVTIEITCDRCKDKQTYSKPVVYDKDNPSSQADMEHIARFHMDVATVSINRGARDYIVSKNKHLCKKCNADLHKWLNGKDKAG